MLPILLENKRTRFYLKIFHSTRVAFIRYISFCTPWLIADKDTIFVLKKCVSEQHTNYSKSSDVLVHFFKFILEITVITIQCTHFCGHRALQKGYLYFSLCCTFLLMRYFMDFTPIWFHTSTTLLYKNTRCTLRYSNPLKFKIYTTLMGQKTAQPQDKILSSDLINTNRHLYSTALYLINTKICFLKFCEHYITI